MRHKPNGRVRNCSFSTAKIALMPHEVGHLSKLRAESALGPLIKCLQTMHKDIVDLELLAPNGQHGAPYVRFADKTMLPLGVLGMGAQKAVAILVRLSMTPGGVALIDEVETGLHHTTLQGLLQQVYVAARDLDVQVFAPTQSYECLEAVDRAMADVPDQLAVFRLQRLLTGDLVAVRLGPDERRAVFAYRTEVR